MSEHTDYLDLDDLIAAARVAVGGDPQVRDWGLLEAALARPRASVFGSDAYEGLHAKAGALLHSLVTNHGLGDGSKRLGLVAVLLFYGLNDMHVAAGEDEKVEVIVAVADGSLRDIHEIAQRLSGWTR